MLTSSSNVTEIPELSPTYSIYDAEIGPAVWQVDIGLGVLFSICLVLALLGNAVILFLLARYKPYISANAFTVLAVTLSISDILMVVLSGLPSTISLLQMRKTMDQRFCDVSGFALNFNMRLNSFITTCICMVRCLVVVMPIKARILLNKRALSAMVLCCVIMATFYSSLPFLFNGITGDQITKYTYYKYIGFCMFFVYFDEQTVRIASTFLTEMVFFAPFIVAIVTSSVLLYTLNRRNKYIGLEAKNETKRSAVIVIIRVTILTLICCTPQLAFSIYTKCNRAYDMNWFSLRTEMYLNYMFGQQLIIYLRASINPFIIDMPAYLKRGKAMRKTKLAMKEHGKLSVASHMTCTNTKVIYRARPGTISYGNSVASTPINTPRNPEVELKVPSREGDRCPHRDKVNPALCPQRDNSRAPMFEQHSVLEYRSAEEMYGNGHGERDASPRRMYRKKRRAKSTENVSADVDMDRYDRGVQNGRAGETGKRQIKIRRSKTDCGARRGKVLARTQSAKWSQKFLIGHNE